MVAGTRSTRMMVASTSSATIMPTPISLMNVTPEAENAPTTMISSRARLVIRPPVRREAVPGGQLAEHPGPPDRGERHEHERDAEGQPPPGVQGSSPCLEHPRLPLTVDNLSKRRKLNTSVTSHTAFTDVKRDNGRQRR